MAPPRLTDAGHASTPRLLWDMVRDFVLSTSDNAAYEIELLDYELIYLAPRRVAWGKAETEAVAKWKRGEIEMPDAFVPCYECEDGHNDEQDWQDALNRWVEVTTEKAMHQATLQRLGFWRRAILFGVAREEITDEKLLDLHLIATDAAIGSPRFERCAAFPASLVQLMVWRDGEDTGEDEDTAPATGAEWVSEFEKWLNAQGFLAQDFRNVPKVRADELEAMKARGQQLSGLYFLVEGDDDLAAPVRFICDDPRVFERWGATSSDWGRFLASSDRKQAWLQWLQAEDAPALDDGIAELEAI